MTDPLTRFATRATYGARQLPRLAWYAAHAAAVRRLAERVREEEGASKRPRAHTAASLPDRSRLYEDMAALFRQDLANVEAGLYPLPADHDGPLLPRLRRSGLFFEDLPSVHRRHERGGHSEVLTEETRDKRPRYYLQNFHFQTGGWMTEDSAQRYDFQVEVLFSGTANAMRRQARLCCTDRLLRALKASRARTQTMRTDIERPSLSMRLRARAAMTTSVARCWSVRERSTSRSLV